MKTKIVSLIMALIGVATLMLGFLGTGLAYASTSTSASSTGATTVDPLQYPCTTGASTCNNIGLTHDWLNGQNVDALYTQNFFCDTSVSSHAPSGCEAGAPATKLPPGVASASNTDPLYIPVPLFSPGPSGLQCPAGVPCIDHPTNIDLSRLASALGKSPAALQNAMLPGHDHIITTRNNNLPEWWNVVVVGVTNPTSWNKIVQAKSYSEVQTLQANSANGVTANIPTNAFLYFQTLQGTLPQTRASVTSSAVPPSATTAGGTTFTNLKNDCTTGASTCNNIGLTHDWLNGQNVDALYTQNFFCDTSVSSHAPSGCEAGAPATKLPPGVASASNTDPLYIPVPLFSPGPSGLQCPAGVPCIDHPTNIDLSRLASALGKSPAALQNAMLPGHDHIITTRNNNLPEWWNVVVVGVTNPTSWNKIVQAKSYSEVQTLQANSANGVTANIPTNAFLSFQTLPGNGPVTPAQVTAVPQGAPATGGGGTAGVQNTNLFLGGGVLITLAIGIAAYDRRRRSTL